MFLDSSWCASTVHPLMWSAPYILPISASPSRLPSAGVTGPRWFIGHSFVGKGRRSLAPLHPGKAEDALPQRLHCSVLRVAAGAGVGLGHDHDMSAPDLARKAETWNFFITFFLLNQFLIITSKISFTIDCVFLCSCLFLRYWCWINDDAYSLVILCLTLYFNRKFCGVVNML